MEKFDAKIYHLYHSGFSVETSNHFLIFDYYLDDVLDGKPRTIENGVISPKFINSKQNVLVFVSHNHSDHFNPIIYQWQSYNPNITYILGDDIFVPANINNVFTMKTFETLTLNNNTFIKTYGTTDRGVSFFVEVDGLKIYHAGDLNWWNWKSFTKQQRLKEEEDFKLEVNKITEEIDIAFVPVDPRLEESFYLGGEYFAHSLHPKLLVPMHFGDRYDITQEFYDKMLSHPTTTALINKRGELIEFNTGKARSV